VSVLSHMGHVKGHRSLPAACAGHASSSRPAGIDVSASSRHSLHVLLMRWCWQMLAPPHSEQEEEEGRRSRRSRKVHSKQAMNELDAGRDRATPEKEQIRRRRSFYPQTTNECR
jgi:hypothetical protein